MLSDLEEAERDPRVRGVDLQWGRLIERFSFQANMAPEEYFSQALEVCRSPQDIGYLTYVSLPLLSAAQSGQTGPVPRVAVDQHLLDTRLREFDDVRARAFEELESRQTGLSGMATLADPGTVPAVLLRAANDAQGNWPDELPRAVARADRQHGHGPGMRRAASPPA